jgi:hypothetical protein
MNMHLIAAVLDSAYDPRQGILGGVLCVGIGYALIRYRDAIGGATGYFARGMYVDAPTPGWLLVPFGILVLAAGVLVLVGSLVCLLGG